MCAVEWKKLGDVCSFQRGSIITEKDAIPGDVPVLSGGQKPAYYHNQYNRKGETVVVAGSGAYAGFVSFWDIPVFLSDSFSVNPNDRLNTKYVFYFLKNIQDKIFATKKGSGVPHVHGSSIAKFEIPIPSLAKQQEIVSHLDTFTTLISNLESELDMRRKQYEHYRNQLLDFEGVEGVEWKTLGDVGNVCMCKRIMKEETSEQGDIPFFKIGTFGSKADAYISNELYEKYKKEYSFPKKGDILISASGTIGRLVVFDGNDAYFQDSNIVWIDNDESLVSNAYLKYYYQIVEWKTDGGIIKRLYNNNLRATRIVIPSKQTQQEIVEKLDAFENLIQSLETEIKLRKQQYEYYREKVLTFD